MLTSAWKSHTLAGLFVTFCVGCAHTNALPRTDSAIVRSPASAPQVAGSSPPAGRSAVSNFVQPAAFKSADSGPAFVSKAIDAPSPETLPPPSESSLGELEQLALDQNPQLRRLYQEYLALAARSRYVDKLPDPKIGVNVFGNPLETAAGSQRANLNVSQMLPWLGRLNAEQQSACFQALAARADFAAEQLQVVAEVRVGWYRLYVLDKQIETANANQSLLGSLTDIANARIAAGAASQGDVLAATLELSQLEERLYALQRQHSAVQAELNRLTARPANTPVAVANSLPPAPTPASFDTLRSAALAAQPELAAAQLRTQATRWGVEVAKLNRRPDLMLSANYYVTDDNRPPSNVVNVGQDPWAIGAQISVPLGSEKYDAMRQEAGWRHLAAHNSADDLVNRYESRILDLLSEIQRANETANLYDSTIIPQARQTLRADQAAYTNGTVEFDRVIRDYRNLLTLELGYHTAVGDRAIAFARLCQAVGSDLIAANPLPYVGP